MSQAHPDPRPSDGGSRELTLEPSEREPEPRRVVLLWALATLVAAFLAALVPMYFSRRFYFAGDTQSGAFGAWYHLGSELLDGRWPLMDPSYWGAGNYVVEGQWGLWNPVIMLVGVLAASVEDAALFSAVVKIVGLVLGAGGGFLLIRSYGARASMAALGGLAVTLTGFTVYMDASSWVTGLFVWALWPYAWWGLRRTAYAGRNPLPALLAGYLLVTVGYVHGTLLLAITIGALIIEALVARRRRSALVATGLGVLTGMVAFTVHLPALLSVGVTARREGIVPAGILGTDGGDFLTSALPFGARGVNVFGNDPTPAPLTYIAWFLPLLFFVDWSRVRRRPAEFVALGVVAVAAIGFILSPVIGPIRFPMRVTPYLATVVIIGAVVAFDRGLIARPGRTRVIAAVAAAFAPSYISFALKPDQWAIPAVAALLVTALVALVWAWLRFARPTGPLSFGLGRFAAVCMVASLGVTVVQHHYTPGSGLAELRLPGKVDYYAGLLPKSEGDVMVVGGYVPTRKERARADTNRDVWQGFALANSWYLADEAVANMYTPVNYDSYRKLFCVKYNGFMCPDALRKLFNHPQELDVPRADLMSVSTVVLDKRVVPEAKRAEVPEGWEQVGESENRIVWRRETPVPSAGGPTYTSPGLEIGDVQNSDREVSFTVDEVPSGGGEVVLSRLPWPGYSVANAAFADPVEDYLLTLSVPESSEGETVTVSYAPPRWGISVAFWVLSVTVTLALSLAWAVLTWRNRRRRSVGERPDEGADVLEGR